MFCGIEVTPGEIIVDRPPHDLHVSQIALDADAKPGRTVVSVAVGDDETVFALCTLELGRVDSVSTSLVFSAEETVSFQVKGPNKVHLTGYYIAPSADDEDGDDEDDDEDDDDFDADDDDDAAAGASDDDEGDEGDEDDDEDDDDEGDAPGDGDEVATLGLKRKVSFGQSLTPPQSKKPRLDAPRAPTPAKPAAKEPAVAAAKPVTPAADKAGKQEPKQQKQQQQQQQQQQQKLQTPTQPAKTKAAQQPKAAESPKSPAAAAPKQAAASPRVLAGGLQVLDLQAGHGKTPTAGKQIQVKYVGKLPNGKTFDSSLNKPFSFKYGVGEVIKGWDEGLRGLAEGGKRKLVIPPGLAYGKARMGDIPPNSTLIFEVEMVRCL